jgi:hypothetical protein
MDQRKIFPSDHFKIKIIITMTIVVFFLFLSSCSIFTHRRYPANTEQKITTIEKLNEFKFQHSHVRHFSKNYGKLIAEYIENTNTEPNDFKVALYLDTSLSRDVAYYTEFIINKDSFKVLVHHSAEALNDPVSSSELMNFFRTVQNKRIFLNKLSPFEMYYNAIKGDLEALQNWAKIRVYSAHLNSVSEFGVEEAPQSLAERESEWAKVVDSYLIPIKQKIKMKNSQDLKRRPIMNILDKAQESLQFKNLIAKNDRHGVAHLLKNYLPWEHMAPFEKSYWENYLDIIKNPLPMNKRVLIYRGLDDNFIYSAYNDGIELKKDMARKYGNIFIMATIIGNNQGSWNRRLRSLLTMYNKFIATNPRKSDEFTKSARISTMFSNHAITPLGSPFISLTPSFFIAQTFGSSKMASFALDPRLLSFNFSTKYDDEREYLTPLLVFPEDVASYFENGLHSEFEKNEEDMRNLFRKNLTVRFGEKEGDSIYQDILKNSKEYFNISDDSNQSSKFPFNDRDYFLDIFNNIYSKKHISSENISDKNCLELFVNFMNYEK